MWYKYRCDGSKHENQTVTMGMANFTCRYQQANVEDYYKSMMGAKSSSELWSKDLYGNGTTMEDTMKDSVMEQLHEMYTLQAHMKDYDVSVTKDEKAAIKKLHSSLSAIILPRHSRR